MPRGPRRRFEAPCRRPGAGEPAVEGERLPTRLPADAPHSSKVVAAVQVVATVAVLRAVQGATLGVGATSGLPDPPLLAVLSPAEAPDRQLAVVSEFSCR